MNAQAPKLEAAENDLKQLMADVTRAIEKAQEAVARIASKTAASTTAPGIPAVIVPGSPLRGARNDKLLERSCGLHVYTAPSELDWNRRAQVIEHGTVEIDHLFQPFDVGVSRRAVHDDRSGNVLEARTRPLINTEEAAQIL